MPAILPKLFKEISVFSGDKLIGNGIDDAAKTATNYITLGTDGITIADGPHQSSIVTYFKMTASAIYGYINSVLRMQMTSTGLSFYDRYSNLAAEFLYSGINLYYRGSLRTAVDSSGVKLYTDSSTNVASFGASLIELGKNSVDSAIKFGSGVGQLYYAESSDGTAGSILLKSDGYAASSTPSKVAVGMKVGTSNLLTSSSQASLLVTLGRTITIGDDTLMIGPSSTNSTIFAIADRVCLIDTSDISQYASLNMNDIAQTLLYGGEVSFNGTLAGTAYDSSSHKPWIEAGSTVLSNSTSQTIYFNHVAAGVAAVIACYGDDVGLATGSRCVVDNVATSSFTAKNIGGSYPWRINWVVIGWVNRR